MILNREIPTELSHEADVRWREFCNALNRANLAPFHDADLQAATQRIFAFSDFVVRSCVHAPGMFLHLITSGDLQRSYLSGEYDGRLEKNLQGISENQGLGRSLSG